MRRVIILILFFISKLSFAQPGKANAIILSNGERKVEVSIPFNWTHLAKKGLDSDVGLFVTSAGDTLHYDLGRYSNSLDDPQYYDPVIIDYQRILYWTELGGFKCKVASFSYGPGSEFGIYFPNLVTTKKFGLVKLAVYGKNVSKVGQNELLETFKSLRVLP